MSTPLNRLAEQVLSEYPIGAHTVRLIQTTEMKAVWKVTCKDRVYGLKRLKYEKDKMLFAIQAQKHLQDHGGPVPHIVRTKQGQIFVESGGQVFILYEWAEGRTPSFGNASDLRKAVRLLAKFHEASIGFTPSIPCRESTKLGKWPQQYETMKLHFKEWQNGSTMPKLASALKPHWGVLTRWADQAQSALSRTDYEGMVRRGPKMMCHQDYSEGNVLLNADGGIVLDMDSITYDFPARDLRKLVLKRMIEKGKWDNALFGKIMSWYQEVYPLNREQLRLVYVDLIFPHLFHEKAKNPFRGGGAVPASRLQAAIRIEEEKNAALSKLLQ